MSTLYVPPAFREERPAILHGLMARSPLAMLACNGPDGMPVLSYLPLLLEEDGEQGVLTGHLARANPQLAALAAAGRAVAVFTGPDAYVSPGFYPSKQEHGRVVPTWNYETVHAEGRVELFDDAPRLLALLNRLTTRHEAAQPRPWSVSDAPEAFIQAQLKGITGVTLRIDRLLGKRKLSQNRNEGDLEGVARGLAASPDAGDRDVATTMRAL
jgi:transcriptional regulator